jgi:hypothetical protein
MMKTTNQRHAWKEIEDEIRRVLMAEWDPIGVKDVPEASDEYDGYIGGIYRLLHDGASDERIAEHLSQIETEAMGLPSVDPGSYLSLIKHLRALVIPTLA